MECQEQDYQYTRQRYDQGEVPFDTHLHFGNNSRSTGEKDLHLRRVVLVDDALDSFCDFQAFIVAQVRFRAVLILGRPIIKT